MFAVGTTDLSQIPEVVDLSAEICTLELDIMNKVT